MSNIRTPRALALPMTAAVALLAGHPASAQSIDRAGLEALFGEPVTTSATGAPQRASDVPAAMTIITGEELRRTGAQNLADALRGHAGIDVMQVSANDYEVAIRGGSQPANPRILVMVNGRQVYLDHYGLTSWTNLGIELAEIRQIEIIKGPVSALFGFNAASGAINIITYDPVSEPINRASVEVGNDGSRLVSAVANLKLGDDLGLRLSGGYAEQDEYASAFPLDPHKPYRGNAALDLRYNISDKIDARLNYSYSNSHQTILVPGFAVVGMDYVVQSAQGEVSADTAAGLLSASVQFNDLGNDFELVPVGMTLAHFDANLLVARLQDIVKAGPRDTFRVTAEYRTDSMRLLPDLNGKIRYSIISGGVMWDHRLSSKLMLNLAGRIDQLSLGQSGAIAPVTGLMPSDYDRNLSAWSANAGLVFKPDDRSTFRLQAARGVQAPSLVSTGIAVLAPAAPGVDIRILGNPTINPTITDSAELGYSYDLAATGGKLAATLFYSNTHEVVGFADLPTLFTPTGLLLGSTFVNAGSYDSYGLEASINGVLAAGLKWRLDYTFNQIDNRFGPTVTPIVAPFEALTPKHKIGAELSGALGRIDYDLRTLLRSPVSFPLDGRQSDWTARIDGRVGFTLSPKIKLFAAGENLTGAHFVDNGYVQQAMRVRIGVQVGY